MKEKDAKKVPIWVCNLMKAGLEKAGTQAALAENLGVTQPNIGAYLAGRRLRHAPP